MDPKGVRAGQPAPFVVDASEAGEALLECSVTDSTGARRPVEAVPRDGADQGVYDCVYYPQDEGRCKVEVRYANQHVPGSPFQSRVQPGHDASKVKVTGDGVQPKGVLASMPTSFVIDTRDAGSADLNVVIQVRDVIAVHSISSHVARCFWVDVNLTLPLYREDPASLSLAYLLVFNSNQTKRNRRK